MVCVFCTTACVKCILIPMCIFIYFVILKPYVFPMIEPIWKAFTGKDLDIQPPKDCCNEGTCESSKKDN